MIGESPLGNTADVIFISYKPDVCNLKDLGPSPQPTGTLS